MAGQDARKAIAPSFGQGRRDCLRAERLQRYARAASDRLAPERSATPPAARQRPRPAAEFFGEEFSRHALLLGSLAPNVRGLDDGSPLLDVRLLQGGESLRRLLVSGWEFLPLGKKSRTHLWIGKRIHNRSVESGND